MGILWGTNNAAERVLADMSHEPRLARCLSVLRHDKC